MKILAFDCETTGLDPKNCAITQIAMIPRVNGVELEPFVRYVRPHEGAFITDEALRIQGKTRAEIMAYPPAEEVIEELIEFIDNCGGTFYLLGQNVKFDKEFLIYFFNRLGRNTDYILRFRSKTFCTFLKSKEIFKGKRIAPEKYNLGALCKFFKIPLDNAHDAYCDIRATLTLWDSLMAMETKPMVQEVIRMTHHEKRMKYMSAAYLTVNGDGSVYINDLATQDKVAMEFILTELHELFLA